MSEDSNKIQQALDTLMTELNKMGRENEVSNALAHHLMDKHRTLQQNFWRCIFGAAEVYAREAQHDLRNEASVEACKLTSKALENHHIPFV